MREIKFKTWNQEVGSLHYCGSIFEITDCTLEDNSNCKYLPETIFMQWTGLKDKNGVDIYEGDILRWSDGIDSSTHEVYWDEIDARWYDIRLDDGDSATAYYQFGFFEECKIIGNIYQHPELLK